MLALTHSTQQAHLRKQKPVCPSFDIAYPATWHLLTLCRNAAVDRNAASSRRVGGALSPTTMAHLHLRPSSTSRNNSRASSRRRPGFHTRDSSLSNVLRVQAPEDLINVDAPMGIDPEVLADVVDAPDEGDEPVPEIDEFASLPWYKRPSAWWYVSASMSICCGLVYASPGSSL